MKRIAGILSFFIVGIYQSTAQDVHWSQFNAIPIFQNPGNAGHFNGDYRFVGNYRDQWRSVTVPFSTFALSADMKLPKQQAIGTGIQFFHDLSGDGKLRTVEVHANVSYLIKLTEDSSHTIRPGIHLGMNHRQVNWDAFYFDNQFNGSQYDPTLPTNENYQSDRKTNLTVGLGAVYEYQFQPRKKIIAGIGFYNLNRPNQGFYTQKIQRDIRTNFFINGIYKLDIDWDLVPGLSFSVQGKYREFMVGSSVKYTLVNRVGNYRALYAGLHYRNRDAAILSAGMDYQSWFVGLSYDLNFSKLVPASRTVGGFELAVRYILFHFKPSKSIHRVCPDYI